MFYLTMHSKHFIYGYMPLLMVLWVVGSSQTYGKGRKEGNVLFNDALKTFLFKVILSQTYGKGRKEGRKGVI